MANINTILTERIAKEKIREMVKSDRVSPLYNLIYSSSLETLSSSLKISNIPSIEYRSPLSKSEYESNIKNILILISTIAKSITDLEDEHAKSINKYQRLEDKIKNYIGTLKKDIDILSNFSCYNIGSLNSKQTIDSMAGRIGRYITLPFYIGGAKMYNGRCGINAVSSGDIIFSNLSYISSIPMEKNPSMKITSKENIIKVNLTLSVDEVQSNLFYLNIDNDIVSVDISFSYNGSEILKKTFDTGEILANYEPITFDAIDISATIYTQNTDKPLSLKISDIKIFSNLMFAKTGAFCSKPEKINNQEDVSFLTLNYRNTGDQKLTSTNPLLSVSPNEDNIKYNIIDLDQAIDVTLSKFKYTSLIDYTTLSDITLLNKDYKYKNILESGKEWDAQYKNSIIFYGLNDKLLGDAGETKRFENWTRVGNYWKTSILNYEDMVYVDIKEKTCLLNGREVTGLIKIPTGITNIDIHVKDTDFDSVDMLTKSTIENGYNLAYAFTGLPEYNNAGTLSSIDKKLKLFNVSGVTTLSLDESFMPFSEVISDGLGSVYTLTLTRMPYEPGTYSIEPNSGLIRIYPADGVKSVEVLYYKAAQSNKPCGILFNRLLTFANLPSILAGPSIDTSLFSLAGTDTERYIILPKIPNITNSQMLYNLSDESLFFSAKIQMRSDSGFLTPIIDNANMSVK